MAEVCKCGMPLEKEEDKCKCKESTCYHCCECPEDCTCGCKNRE
ncbi:MAG: hypothetical protein WC514_02545 [Candidatus Paceibacterota bacterium]